MTTVAQVRLWGRCIGAVALRNGESIAEFEYDPDFADSGIEVSPLMMRLAAHHTYRFGQLRPETFHGLPGMLADSLPDRFGNALINAWLATQNRDAQTFNAVERLCYTGARGMGALEFIPAMGPKRKRANRIEVDKLVELASEVLSNRSNLENSFSGGSKQEALKEILQVGTSAGGARAKAVIAWNRETDEVRSGQVEAEAGFEHWLLKFDGVANNKDKELADSAGYGAIEYAYHLMAMDAGIDMAECRLLKEGGRRHFMTRRFDRDSGGRKQHMQSLCALAHYDFNLAGAYAYEQALQTMSKLKLPRAALEQQFRRMVFNIIARNQDDHVKNIAFLMNKEGQWSLSPAYDVTYAFNSTGRWTSMHQMSLNGKGDAFEMRDFQACAKLISMKRGQYKQIIEEVQKVVVAWPDYADKVGVTPNHRDGIAAALRITPFT